MDDNEFRRAIEGLHSRFDQERRAFEGIHVRLDHQQRVLTQIEERLLMATQAITDLTAEVTRAETQEAKAIVLIQGLQATIVGLQAQLATAIASGDMSEVQALHDSLASSNDAIQALVDAATPAAAATA